MPEYNLQCCKPAKQTEGNFLSTTHLAKLTARYFVSLKFFSSSFQSGEQWSAFDETSCWNASHQCSCSSADFCAALCSSCTVFHISVVQNGLCWAHPSNRKVVRFTFPTAFICKSSFSSPMTLCPGKLECGWIGYSYTKPFKSYLRHFCGLKWLDLVSQFKQQLLFSSHKYLINLHECLNLILFWDIPFQKMKIRHLIK